MRMTKFILPAVTLAGALALAGCGGGGNSMEDMDMENGRENGGETGGFSAADLPEGAEFEYNQDQRKTVTVGKGSSEIAGSNLAVTCENDDGCQYRVLASSIETTNGATVVLTSSLVVSSSGGTSPQPTAAADPLSAETIAEALKVANSKVTIWSAAGAAAGFSSGALERVTVDGETVRLNLGGDAALHWGYWHRYKAPAVPAPAGKRTAESAGAIYGGTMSRYGVKPDDGIATARYDDDDAVELYFKNGSGDWTDGGTANADLILTANFGEGKVGGQITGVAGALTGVSSLTGGAADIVLEETDIGSAGTFSGSAKFQDGDVFSRRSGGWEGAFFGPRTRQGSGDGEDTNRQYHAAPSKVAGTFTVSGRHGTTPADLHVRGAFGADSDPAN